MVIVYASHRTEINVLSVVVIRAITHDRRINYIFVEKKTRKKRSVRKQSIILFGDG